MLRRSRVRRGRDDLDTLVMDAEVFDGILAAAEPETKTKEIEIKLIARLGRHKDNPVFVALGERLEKLKERHEQGLLHSLDFLKELLTATVGDATDSEATRRFKDLKQKKSPQSA